MAKDIKWASGKRNIEDLKPAAYNPRKWDDQQKERLKDSLDRFSLADPIIINKDNTVIGGHFRIETLKKSGVTEVDVRFPDRQLSEAEEKELNLRLNKNLGNWDFAALGQFGEAMLTGVGFDSQEMDNIFKPTADKKEDSAPACPKIPTTKRGEVWQCGSHRMMCGDSADLKEVKHLMGAAQAAMVFTDPPYNVDYHGGMSQKGENDREPMINDQMDGGLYFEFLSEICRNINEFCIGGIYICMSTIEMDTIKKAFEENGGHWQDFVIWVKNNFTLGRKDYQQTYEAIMYGWPKGTINHYFIKDRAIPNVWESLKKVKTKFEDGYTKICFHGFEVKLKGKVEGQVKRKKQITDIWRYDKPVRSAIHPTMKPVAMITEAVLNSSKRGQIVLDLFLGSGSTMIACEKTNRICHGMEIDPLYCDVIIKRWEEYTGKKAVKINGKE